MVTDVQFGNMLNLQSCNLVQHAIIVALYVAVHASSLQSMVDVTTIQQVQ